MGAEDWTLKVIKHGYRLPFSRTPPLSDAPIPLQAYNKKNEKADYLSAEVRTMLAKGALEVIKSPSPDFYSRLILVEKATGGWRPVIDLSP